MVHDKDILGEKTEIRNLDFVVGFSICLVCGS